MALPANSHGTVVRQRKNYPQVLEFANESRKEGEFVDVTVVVGKRNIPANKMILSCCSPLFRKMFKTEMKERYNGIINITVNVEADSIEELVNFMYTGTITIANENVMQLLAGADYLQMDEPKQFCIDFLHSIISPHNCYPILRAANLYQIETLQSSIYEMLSDKLDEFSKMDHFKSLSKKDVVLCLSKLKRHPVKEISVYEAIISWAKSDEENRKEHFAELLQLVNLDSLPYKYLVDVVPTEILVNSNVMCMNLVMESMRKLLKNTTLSKVESTIISIGGENTNGMIIEVFNFDKTLKTVPDQSWTTLFHCKKALKLDDHIYFLLRKKVNFVITLRGKISKEKLSNVEVVAEMREKRDQFDAAVYAGGLVVVGEPIHSTEYYNPNLNEWKVIIERTSKAEYDCICHNALVSCQGCLYNIGIWNEDCSNFTAVAQLCSVLDVWMYVEPLQTGRSWHAAVSYNNVIYVTGGKDRQMITLSSVEKYDPTSDSWVYVKNMKLARWGHAACVLRGKIYVVGGRRGVHHGDDYVKEIECYDPDCDTWTIVGTHTEKLAHHSLVVL